MQKLTKQNRVLSLYINTVTKYFQNTCYNQTKLMFYFMFQLVAREYPFVMWLDSSIRFIKPDTVTELVALGKRLDLVVMRGYGTIIERTLPQTFDYFGEDPCRFRQSPEIQGGFMLFKVTRFYIDNILKPWVGCALTLGCMLPKDGVEKYIVCRNVQQYGQCHRSDQSAWAIILYRLYGKDIELRKVSDNGPLLQVKRAG